MGFAATLQTTFQPKISLQQRFKPLFSQKQTYSNTTNHFSAKNKLAAALQTTFSSQKNLQQHCKPLFIQKQTCSNTANHFSSKNKLAATLQTTFQLKTGLQQRCKSHVNGKQHLFFHKNALYVSFYRSSNHFFPDFVRNQISRAIQARPVNTYKNQRFHIFTFPFSFIILYPIKANMQVAGFFCN